MSQKIQTRICGAVSKLWDVDFHPPEALIVGPRNTGKSRGVGHFIYDSLTAYPGMRALVARKTRVSMNETFLKTWEQDVLPPYWKEECARVVRGHREKYVFEHEDGDNSELIVAGMDQERLIGADLDLVVVDEAYQLQERQWIALLPLLRNKRAPFQMALALTNPAGSKHWLNRRPDGKRMVRLLSCHEDNPSITEADLERLRALPEPYRTRWYTGDWVAAEGLYYPEWNEKVHLRPRDEVPPMKGHFGAMDFGWDPSPGVFQVWGVDHSDRIWLLVELYQRKRHLDKWAAQIERLHEEFELQAIVCDSAESRSIDFLNQHLSSRFGRAVGEIAQKADKNVDAGRQAVLFAMSPTSGGPRLFVSEGYQRAFLGGGDAEAQDEAKYEGLPSCFTEEIENFIVEVEKSDGTPGGDRPEKYQADHSMDCLRYACCYARDNVFTAKTSQTVKQMGWEAQELYRILGPKAFWEYVAGVPGARAVPSGSRRRAEN